MRFLLFAFLALTLFDAAVFAVLWLYSVMVRRSIR